MSEELTSIKTPYDWCLDYNVRPYNPELWGDALQNGFGNVAFHKSKIDEVEFLDILKTTPHKLNSRPRKFDEFLELRMYGFVIYQLSGIQTGIQFKHAVTDYGQNIKYTKK
jgi:isocitrate dehydrogenase kinase/phosphatase